MSKNIPPKEVLEDLHFKQYLSIPKIANHYTVPAGTVRGWFSHYNIKAINGHTLDNPILLQPETKGRVQQLLNERHSVLNICRIIGCNRKALCAFINQNGLKYNNGGYTRTLDKRFYDKEWLYNEHKIKKRHVKDIADELNVHIQSVWHQLRKYNIECIKVHGTSKMEKDVLLFIKSLYNGEVIHNTRKLISPLEIDIYIPEKNLAIEFNGSYYHSFDRIETTKERRIHYEKWKMCLEKGVQLLSIFEYDWLMCSERWKNFIKAKLNKTSQHIGARKCDVVYQVPLSMVKDFYEKNHLQGYTSACKYNYALAYNNKIVAMMSFSKTRFQKKATWELMRFAVDNEYRIPGAASRLLSAFRKQHEGPIVSYSDNAYSLGNVYKALGFEKLCDVEPRYGYLKKDGTYYARMSCQKKKIAEFLTDYDASKTEAENMFANGYRRIWDCGKMTWLLT